MSIYSVVETSRGRRYRLGHKFIKPTDIPANVFHLLQHQSSVDVSNMKVEAPLKRCIICEQPANMTRFLNMQTVALCEEHYYSSDITIGVIAQHVREKLHGQEQSTEEK